MRERNYQLEIISKGSFYDAMWDGAGYVVRTITFRALGDTYRDWSENQMDEDSRAYIKREDYEAAQKKLEDHREEWTGKVLELLGWHEKRESYHITNVLSEIFTAVFMEKVVEEEPCE